VVLKLHLNNVPLISTAPPDCAIDLRVVDSTDTTITIAFEEPEIKGEGFFYIIKYSDPVNTGSFLSADITPGSLIINEGTATFTLTDLEPNTPYTIKVITNNIVSHQDQANDGLRLRDIQGKTKQGGEIVIIIELDLNLKFPQCLLNHKV